MDDQREKQLYNSKYFMDIRNNEDMWLEILSHSEFYDKNCSNAICNIQKLDPSKMM